MKNKRRKIILSVMLALMVIAPASAVLSEKNLANTLSVLRYELLGEYSKQTRQGDRFRRRNNSQHEQMVDMIKKCNKLSLVLYSQHIDYTFDMTYALNEVTQQYEAFNKRKMPYDDIVHRLDVEIDRYERLIESLRRLPPILDEMAEVPDSLRMAKDSLMKEIGPVRLPSPQGPQDQMEHAPESDTLAAGGVIAAAVSMLDEAKDQEDRTFVLDSASCADRDSCLRYARGLLMMYKHQRQMIQEDKKHYENLSERLKESYDYAQTRYKAIQEKIFIDGQDNYFNVLKDVKRYSRRAWQDASDKYMRTAFGHSEWRGPVVIGFLFIVLLYIAFATVLSSLITTLLAHRIKALGAPSFKSRMMTEMLLCGFLIFALTIMVARAVVSHNFFLEASDQLLVYAWLVIAILFSLLIRLKPEELKESLILYAPLALLGLIMITLRVIFMPNRMVNLTLPPLLLLFTVWQYFLCRKSKRKARKSDMASAWATFAIMLVATVMAWCGYVLLSVQVFIWWLFQLTALQTISALYYILSAYEGKGLKKRKEKYIADNDVANKDANSSLISVTWLFDATKMAILPILAIVSVPLTIYLATDVFDLSEICKELFFKPFINLTDSSGVPFLHLSMFKLVVVLALFFVFRYVVYLGKAEYRRYKIQKVIKTTGNEFVQDNDVNLTLSDNIISICLWGLYIIISIELLKIPLGAISVVAAGLATGIGLALKDILNNFIYGIQLMSGRLRVGDYVECDDVRGKVLSISYQSTQIETLDGAVMAFTNTTLFNKNFKNLTRNNMYEAVKIPVGVGYGADIKKVRDVLTEALQALDKKDKFGRNIIDQKYGIVVNFSNFGDSSVDLIVKQYVIVEYELSYIAQAKEIIYNTLNANGIEIPFPQRDVHIK